MKKKLILLVVLCVISCGIEQTIPVLRQPVAGVSAESSDIFIFLNTIEDLDNMNYFKGFELYYKFYNTSEEADAEKNITTYESIVKNIQSGFWRIHGLADNERISKPLIEIPEVNKNGVSRFIIDFSSIGHVVISALPESGSNSITFSDFPIYRGVKNEEMKYKDFSIINKTDLDVSSIKDITNGMYLAIYVFSYGIFELSQDLYSNPVWLNKIQLY